MRVTEETITPKKAQELLDKHWVKDHQRNPSHAVVDAYARAMAANQWLLTHQGIAIDDKNELIDGVQRLLAVVQSGSSVRMLITRGVAHNGIGKTCGMHAIDAVDRGRVRAVGQQLQLRHGIANGNVVAAASRGVLWLALHSIGQNIGRTSVGDSLRVMDFYGAELNYFVDNRSNLPGLRIASTMGAFAFAAKPFPEIKDAYVQFVSGENLSRGNPMYALRNFLLSGDRSYNGSAIHTVTRAVLLACHKHVIKESLTTIRASSDIGYTFFLEKQRPTVKKLLALCGYSA